MGPNSITSILMREAEKRSDLDTNKRMPAATRTWKVSNRFSLEIPQGVQLSGPLDFSPVKLILNL